MPFSCNKLRMALNSTHSYKFSIFASMSHPYKLNIRNFSTEKMAARRGNFFSGLTFFPFVLLGIVSFPAEAAIKKYQFDVS